MLNPPFICDLWYRENIIATVKITAKNKNATAYSDI